MISLEAVRKDLEDKVNVVTRGWAKLPTIQKRRALRRIIHQLYIGPGVIDIYYYSNALVSEGSLEEFSISTDGSFSVLPFRPHGTQVPLRGINSKSEVQNCRTARVVNLVHHPAMCANPHDFIEFPFYVKANIFAQSAPLYEQGLSLREIATRLEIPKTTIRKELLKNGVSLRPSSAEIKIKSWRPIGKRSQKPPYGFCFFEGRTVRHPKEYPVLLQIHRRWKSGQNANSVAVWLNGKKIPSPMNKSWSWNSIINIIDRFKSGSIFYKGGRLGLR